MKKKEPRRQQGWSDPDPAVATIAERIARAREATARAKMALIPKEPVRNAKPIPDPNPGYHYHCTWRGKKILIPKNKFGW